MKLSTRFTTALMVMTMATPIATLPFDDEDQENPMNQVRGTFEVKIEPSATDSETGVGTFTLDKTFSGGFDGRSRGMMLTSVGEPRTSAVYVAIERLEGNLHGLEGSFVIVHRGIRTKDREEALLDIAPDSGTGDLEGIEGRCKIEIKDSKHSYTLEYRLPED